MGDVIFSLDIGTRNVVGIIAKMEDGKYKVIDYEIKEHPDRAMYDGQIHDIEKVSMVVNEVKTRLEKRLGIELKYVSIAAAGRALKTQKVYVEKEIDFTKEIDKAIIDTLEIEGIQSAQKQLDESSEKEDSKYYCVGYTVMNYYLDGSIIGNLKGHRGKVIGADILATFLPHVVVDSLYTAVHNCGLEVINLTLEPIAAINMVIPPKFRLLNLALVDVGAGTSDIAITKDGTIVSYAMVSVAGDEITESLSKAFLLDFDSAEKLKIQLNKKNEHSFCDIVGIQYSLNTDEIIEKIEESIKNLSKEIANKILEYNGKAPSAVFCIGGGSQIPKFTESLAEYLELPKERVVIKEDVLENVEFLKDCLRGPEYITPIGIGYTAIKDKEQDFLQVTVNGKSIRLFNSRQLSVSDALILIGYNARKLIATKGKPISFYINGKKKTVHGEYGESAKIYVNNEIASLDTKLKNMDKIVVDPATPGKDAKVKLKDIVNRDEKVIFNGKEINIVRSIYINGEEAQENYEILDDDRIVVDKIDSVVKLMSLHNMNLEDYRVYIDGKLTDGHDTIRNGSIIETEFILNEKEEIVAFDQIDELDDVSDFITVKVNGKDVKINNKERDIIFVDIFNHIDFDITTPKGILVLKLNGERANYTDILKNNDIVEIYWK